MTEINYRGLDIPFTKMGSGRVTSDNLFDPNEQVIFDFYEANCPRYKRAVDIGANIGVHTILMARQGWFVHAYEPDPVHFNYLAENVAQNHCARQVELHRSAVSHYDGKDVFVRVCDNTTGSHLRGAKDSYGPRETFPVDVVDCRPLFEWADFVKVDCEGHEATLITAVEPHCWADTDALMEVGNAGNAHAIYLHLCDMVPMWSQKIGWARVQTLDDMPKHHSEGSLFVGQQPPFPAKT